MNGVKRAIYRSCVLAVKAYQHAFMDVRVRGRTHIPPGPKIYASNHISAFDGLWIMPVFTEPVCYVIGPQYKFGLLARVFDAYDQINAMPHRRGSVVDDAVDRLERGRSVYICPEGDLQDQSTLGRFYPGVARMYLRTRVPIIPIALVAPKRYMREYPFPTVVDGRVYRCVVFLRGPFFVNVGEPMWPDADDEATDQDREASVLSTLKDRIAALVDDARRNKFWRG
ncbi:MAG: lysophospholipid acyltransferase family protein [Phycisphaerae bacterium]